MPLSWTNLDTVSVRFSKDVVFKSVGLRVRGTSVAQCGVKSFANAPATFTAPTPDAIGVLRPGALVFSSPPEAGGDPEPDELNRVARLIG